MWSGDALWIAIGTITPVLLIESEGAAPVVDDGGVGGRRGGGWV
ncbi:MAG: hypothetical protein WA130_08385 [Candidatus Methanoperedens sp.]